MAGLRDLHTEGGPAWNQLEAVLDRVKRRGLPGLDRDDLASLGRLYRKAASHLAYARTHRMDSDLIAYLNGLVGRAHAVIYVRPPGSFRDISLFFRRTFPAVLQRRFGFILLSFLIMTAGLTFGFGLQIWAPEAVDGMIPGGAAHVYERFVANEWFNDPLGERPAISAGIMTNNIFVAVQALAGGIIFGLYTVLALYGNGFLIGAVSGVFAQNGHALDFWAIIAPHGVIELTAIWIAGGAGLLLASALLFPGRYRRRDALILRGRDTVVLFGGVAALLVAAGAIEGFISTIGTLGNGPRLAIAVFTALVLYPYLLWPRGEGKDPHVKDEISGYFEV